MNLTEDKYTKFGLVHDMLAVPDLIRQFDAACVSETAAEIAAVGKLLLTGEGSSRLFPMKSALAEARQRGVSLQLQTDAGYQAAEYDLDGWAVLAASNSGKTAEVIRLFESLEQRGHTQRYSLSAHADTPLAALAKREHVLSCGKEGAVAATKSVVEQALFVRALIEQASGLPSDGVDLQQTAEAFAAALAEPIPSEWIEDIAQADTIYIAGRNNGAGEELTLKTNEITRKRADFLEGTYAVHGVEEVMAAGDVLIWLDPYAGAEDKFASALGEKIGVKIVAISARETRFPTLRVADAGLMNPYVQLAAGWNLLVEAGLALAIDLDRPQRARKVGFATSE